MTNLNYRVCSINALRRTVKSHDGTHVVSLVDPDMSLPRTPSRARGRHTGLRMHDVDIVDTGNMLGNPHVNHVDTLVKLGRSFSADDRPVFHCVAGKRRSAAAALICDLAYQLQHGAQPTKVLVDDCWAHLRNVREIASPNRALLSLADDMLGFQGHLANLKVERVLTLD